MDDKKRTLTDTQLHCIAMQILAANDEAESNALTKPLTLLEMGTVRELCEMEMKRLTAECRLFIAWVEKERSKGQPEHKLTFGRFVRESGILRRDGLRAQ